MTRRQGGPPGVGTGAALKVGYARDCNAADGDAEDSDDSAAMRQECGRVARRRWRQVQQDLFALQQRLQDADGWRRDGTRFGTFWRGERTGQSVTVEDFDRLARVVLHLAALLGLCPTGGEPW